MRLFAVVGVTCLLQCIVLQAGAQPYLTSDVPRPMAKRNIELGRTFDASSSGTINNAAKVPKPTIITKAEWGGGESSGTMKSHFPISITFHHEGSPKPLTPNENPKELLQKLQKYGWNQKNWPDLPYHYLVDLDGNLYEGRDPMHVGDTNTKYNPAGKLLISVMGNYELQAANEKQLTKIADLMAWLCDYYNIPPDTIRGHMEYTPTDCPGKYLYPFVASGFFEGEVRKRIAKAYGASEDGETTSTTTIGKPR